jgi:hypothetical protein
MRARAKLLFGTVAIAAIVGLAQLLSSSAATAQGQAATQRVIVVLKNQEQSLPATSSQIAARRSAVQSAQRPVAQQLSNSGAANVHSYTLLDAMSATVSPSEEAALKANPAVSAVIPDHLIRLASPHQTSSPTSGGPFNPSPAVCTPGGKTQLNPEAVETIHADSDNPSAQTARALGITGQGVKVAFIADGIDPRNQDFIRANGHHVIIDFKDFSGEGTGVPTGGGEGFLDASSIAAQGLHTYNVSHYSGLPLSRACNIRIEGVAPGASVVALDIFGREDTGFTSAWLQAIDYAVSVDHVQVINESLGDNFYPDDGPTLDLIKQANDQAVAAGTSVTVSTGDAGITNTLSTPGTDPAVISVGASTTFRQLVQEGLGGRLPTMNGGWLDNNISALSSAGFDQNGRTQDVVAPGDSNWALCSLNTQKFDECTDDLNRPAAFQATGGTSESSPLTAGEAALVIQAYRKTHGGNSPSPAVVKQIITSTAQDIGSPAEQQGSGLIDAYQAVLGAESYRAPASTPRSAGTGLLFSQPQLNVVAAPGSTQTLTEQVTNNGSGVRNLTVSSRTLGAYRPIGNGTVKLTDNGPHFTDWHGLTDNYQRVTFNVPQGSDRLDFSIAYQAFVLGDLDSRVRVTLVDPLGRLAAYSEPQGTGNYGDDQITEPVSGQWNAYISSRGTADGGTTGPVVWAAQVAQYTPFGHVSPSTLTLAPGQSGTLTLHVPTPATPGDEGGSIVLTDSSGPSFTHTTTVPVTLRSLIPQGPQSFTQTLTGGNGRSFNTGQEFYYQLDVPAGRPELNASVTLADNPHNPFSAWLISPSGEAQAFASNDLPANTPSGLEDEIGAQLHVLSPAAGAWSLIVAFVPQVSGTAISEPFTVATNEKAVPVTPIAVPNSANTQLTDGQTTTAHIRITNNGSAPAAYFVDARLPGMVQRTLLPFGGDATSEQPLTIFSNIPTFLVPTETSQIDARSSTDGPQPIAFDMTSPAGDPDVGSTTGATATASHAAQPVTQGLWAVVPQEVGVFGQGPGPTETTTSAMTATFRQFDLGVTSETGDLWQGSIDSSAIAGFNPIILDPGQSFSIPVHITPNGASGTVVRGTLYVDDTNLILFQAFLEPNGDHVAAVPYKYTIK